MRNGLLQSILADRGVMDEIKNLQRIPRSELSLDQSGISVEAVRNAAESLANAEAAPEGVFERPITPADLTQPEAIVLLMGRPPLLIQDNQIAVPELDEWRVRIWPHLPQLQRLLPSVGRVELRRHFQFPWVGTGWMIDEDIIVTNRHVAEIFAAGHGRGVAFRKNEFGETILVRVDFREEHERTAIAEFDVSEIIWVEDAGGPDMAFIRLKKAPSLPPPLPLSTHVPQRGEGYIAVVGYPARDPDRNDLAEMDRIFAKIYEKKRFSPGELMTVAENNQAFSHDCTTLGGNSGSPVLDIQTGTVVGLHYAGRYLRTNFAVPSQVVLDRLAKFAKVVPVARVEESEPRKSGQSGAGGKKTGKKQAKLKSVEPSPEAVRPISHYEGRGGYEREFISGIEAIEPPKLTDQLSNLAAPVDGGGDELKYTHFSVWMNSQRQLAFFTAVNIDGSRLIRFPRSDDKWFIDPRITKDSQIDNKLYKNNRLDRGHLVRRLDPVWGEETEAREAMEDTFHYTNAAPQHEGLNQVTWNELEDHLLDNAGAHEFKLSVFTGPVLGAKDRKYRGVALPKEYWKVVVMAKEARGKLVPHATAYVLSQADLLTDIEFVFGAFKTYQVPLRRIERTTQLDLGHLREFDPLETGTEAPARPIPISGWRDIVI